MLDEALARHLHVQSLRRRELHPEHEPHVLFQASTIGALLDGRYDGDVSFGELAEHGDFGLGTLNALDGEMIAVDGRFYRADLDGVVAEVDPRKCTPFAVLVWFEPTLERRVRGPLDQTELLARLDRLAGGSELSFAIRVEGDFELVRARSVPRQRPPYRPLAEVVADQHTFELREPAGTLVGFRFPTYATALEIGGYHLHFISADRTRGGHVLDCRVKSAVVQLDLAAELHVELPPGVELDSTPLDQATARRIERVEREG